VKKGKKPSGEQQRRIPLQDGQKEEMSCDQKESLQSNNTFNEYVRVDESGWEKMTLQFQTYY